MSYPSRRTIRMPDFNYSHPGAYFVTICTCDRQCWFGNIADGAMRLNEWGEIVRNSWDELPDHFPNVELDQFVVMPNHVHGIIVLEAGNNADRGINMPTVPITNGHVVVGAQFIAPDDHASSTHAGAINRAPTIGNVVRNFKARCTHAINLLRHAPGHALWQRNYYEHVIRDDGDLAAIRMYIAANPARWTADENYPGCATTQSGNRQNPLGFTEFLR